MTAGGMVLGVDGGSTKTHLALADSTGRLRGFAAGPGTNHETRGFSGPARILASLLARACRRAGIRVADVRAASVGLCGCDLPDDVPAIRRNMIGPLGLTGPVEIGNDALIALCQDRFRARGLVVSLGGWHKWLAAGRRTAMHDGLHARGIRAIALGHLSRVHEGFEPATAHTRRMLRWLGFRGAEDYVRKTSFGEGKRAWIRRITAFQRRRMQRVTEWLGREADRGSRGARRAVILAAEELAEGAAAVVRSAGGLHRTRFDAVLSGSVLANVRALQRALGRELRRAEPRVRIIPARYRPVRGALVRAARAAWGGFPPGSLTESRLRY